MASDPSKRTVAVWLPPESRTDSSKVNRPLGRVRALPISAPSIEAITCCPATGRSPSFRTPRDPDAVRGRGDLDLQADVVSRGAAGNEAQQANQEGHEEGGALSCVAWLRRSLDADG